MNAAELIILDVGHGNSAVIHENCITIVVDAGRGSHLLEYLSQKGIQSIDLVILSHADQDHIAGLTSVLLNGICIKRIVLNSDSTKASQTWRELILTIDFFQTAGDTVLTVGITTGKINVVGLNEISIEAVSPSALLAAYGVGSRDRHNRLITSNSISSCIRVLNHGRPIALLSGDIDDIALDEAIFSGVDMEAPLVVFPHHGGLPGNCNPELFTSKLISHTKPASIVFSHGRSKHDNPIPLVVKRIVNENPDCYIACTQLSKHCSAELPSVKHNHLSGIFSAGEIGNQCCAGTIRINSVTGKIDSPTVNKHKEFIKSSAPTALCRKEVGLS